MSPDPARSLTDRIRNAASAQQIEPNRLRRQLIFQRILSRLARDESWVLKGGYSLEVRLGLRARATRDLDLAFIGEEPIASAFDVQDALAEALESASVDGFLYNVALPRAIARDEAGNPGWRTNVRASLGGVVFESVKLDIVVRSAEIEGATELLRVSPPFTGSEFDGVDVLAVDIAQHAAEKVHAYARLYAHDRPSSRTKDLIDLALLIDCGLLEPDRWAVRIKHVFAVRDGVGPPDALPPPPDTWVEPYAALAEDVGLASTDSADGWRLVDSAYQACLFPCPTSNGTAT